MDKPHRQINNLIICYTIETNKSLKNVIDTQLLLLLQVTGSKRQEPDTISNNLNNVAFALTELPATCNRQLATCDLPSAE